MDTVRLQIDLDEEQMKLRFSGFSRRSSGSKFFDLKNTRRQKTQRTAFFQPTVFR